MPPGTDKIHKSIKLKACLENFTPFMVFIESHLNQVCPDKSIVTALLTASEEIIVNVMHHGYKDNYGDLEIVFEKDQLSAAITFIDEGIQFNPLGKEDFDINTPLEEREAGGLGILMVKKLADDLKYEFINGKNNFTIIKYF